MKTIKVQNVTNTATVSVDIPELDMETDEDSVTCLVVDSPHTNEIDCQGIGCDNCVFSAEKLKKLEGDEHEDY